MMKENVWCVLMTLLLNSGKNGLAVVQRLDAKELEAHVKAVLKGHCIQHGQVGVCVCMYIHTHVGLLLHVIDLVPCLSVCLFGCARAVSCLCARSEPRCTCTRCVSTHTYKHENVPYGNVRQCMRVCIIHAYMHTYIEGVLCLLEDTFIKTHIYTYTLMHAYTHTYTVY